MGARLPKSLQRTLDVGAFGGSVRAISTFQKQGATDVVKINPKTLAITKLIHRPDDGSFRSGTVAVEVGDRLWIGSFTGDRIAILPAAQGTNE